ncbi:hypothetical protein [Streptosporangium sp. CA-115845]|uniref:hypothetical protein n=1 Tax=Streptosporangium sp. CA-115845 TaxID=3240071 RepID=UPI003D8D64E1
MEGVDRMANLYLHYDALEQCQTAARKLAGRIGDLGDAHPTETTTSIFGGLTDSGALTGLVNEIENAVDGELNQVVTKLKGVGDALEDVRKNVKSANGATS